ncbi:MAG: hypothetical protein H0V66_12415 [Bdellovibrionales bacterium]|nr:hypothetical protein [Bdellovibrionales bacterium]
MSKKLSRMEANKEARRVLNRHQVDLAYCQYSCCGMEVKLNGYLCKHDGSEFNAHQIEAIIYDFQRHLTGFTVWGDFDNWNFNSERISHVGERPQGNGGEEEQTVYVIDSDDYDSEAS